MLGGIVKDCLSHAIPRMVVFCQGFHCIFFPLQVLEGIVKDCLAHAIPSSSKELESFHEVIAITQKFQDKLVALGFMDDSSRTLLDYVQNVNVLFANKKCQSILERARGLMTTDIHDTVLVSWVLEGDVCVCVCVCVCRVYFMCHCASVSLCVMCVRECVCCALLCCLCQDILELWNT